MRTVLSCLLAVTLATPALAMGYQDDFDLPDGSFPSPWESTGDPRGGGTFLVYDGAFTHVDGGSAYYIRSWWKGRQDLGALYLFRVRGSDWAFAWRISEPNPMAGRCMWLSHDQMSGAWGYTFGEISWATLDPIQYPEGQYMWHNWVSARTVLHATPGPLAGWHQVWINDTSDRHVEIWVDSEQIFDEDREYIPEGLQGLGCVAGGGMTPAFDYLIADWPDLVESHSWSSIKALFR
jgi:hypothetical protein